MGLLKTHQKLIKQRDRYLAAGNESAVEILENEINKIRLHLLREANQITNDDLFEVETDLFQKIGVKIL